MYRGRRWEWKYLGHFPCSGIPIQINLDLGWSVQQPTYALGGSTTTPIICTHIFQLHIHNCLLWNLLPFFYTLYICSEAKFTQLVNNLFGPLSYISLLFYLVRVGLLLPNVYTPTPIPPFLVTCTIFFALDILLIISALIHGWFNDVIIVTTLLPSSHGNFQLELQRLLRKCSPLCPIFIRLGQTQTLQLQAIECRNACWRHNEWQWQLKWLFQVYDWGV